MPSRSQAPSLAGFHHFSPTVNDVEASAAWYERVLGLQRLPGTIPHHGSEEHGYAVLLVDPASGVAIGLHHHDDHQQQPADERRTGLDHISFTVAGHDELHAWADWFDEQGVTHSGVIDLTTPSPYSVVVFRDPDEIQLELMYVPS
ncbi:MULTISPECIES: VOC family protein [unclassified Modestobacter]